MTLAFKFIRLLRFQIQIKSADNDKISKERDRNAKFSLKRVKRLDDAKVKGPIAFQKLTVSEDF